MIQRIIYAAAALLLFQIGLTVHLHTDGSHLNAAAPNTAFLSFDPDSISTVQISGPKGGELLLNKTDKGWIMPEAFSAPANGSQIDALLEKLAAAKQGLAVATTEGAAERFKTAEDEFERHLVLKQGDTVAADFYLGTSSGLRRSHARVASQDAVVSIPVSEFEVAVEADKWLDKTLADLNKDELLAVVLEDISLTKKDKGWLLDGATAEEIETGELDKLLNKVTGVSVESVLDPAKAASLFDTKSVMQFTVTKKDDSKRTYTFAKQDDHYALKMSDSELYFKVANWRVEDLAELKRESLLVGYTEKKVVEETQGDTERAEQALDNVAKENMVPEEVDQEVEHNVLPEIPAEEPAVLEGSKVDSVQDTQTVEQDIDLQIASEVTPKQKLLPENMQESHVVVDEGTSEQKQEVAPQDTASE